MTMQPAAEASSIARPSHMTGWWYQALRSACLVSVGDGAIRMREVMDVAGQ